MITSPRGDFVPGGRYRDRDGYRSLTQGRRFERNGAWNPTPDLPHLRVRWRPPAPV